jgi:hypothetical protein
MDFISSCSINIPGGKPISNDIISITLNHKYKINRLSFKLNEPKVISESNDFIFGYFAEQPELIGADILAGDVGFPEIHVENDLGQIYRFKRGNIKDFIAQDKLGELQEVRLPYSAFLFNIDLKVNVKSDVNFFTRPITRISFDFLSNAKHDVDIKIIKPRIKKANPSVLNCFDLLSIEGINKLNGLPLFVTESNSVSLKVSKKEIGNYLYPTNLRLTYLVESNDKVISSGVKPVDATVYMQIPTKVFGPSKLTLNLEHNEVIIATSCVSAIKTLPRSPVTQTKLGISDAQFFDSIDRLGGGFSRVVLSLSSIFKAGSDYKFHPNLNILSLLRPYADRKVIVALKGMPKWLSSKSDNSDCYRYGPESLVEYKKLIKWLVAELSQVQIFAIETWNEANVIHEWNDSFDVLLSIHKIIYKEVKNLDNGFLVLSPSSTSWDFDYFNMLLDKGFYKYSDGLAMHAYSYAPHSHHQLFETLENIGQQCKKENPDFGIYITEVGFRTPSYTDNEQAMYLALFSLQTHFREIFKSILWFRYQNTSSELLGSYHQNASGGYSMLGYQGLYARPMLATYRFLDNILPNVTPLYIQSENDETLFVGEYNNKLFLASFCKNAEHKLFNKQGDMDLNLIDIYGQSVKSESYNTMNLFFQTLD